MLGVREAVTKALEDARVTEGREQEPGGRRDRDGAALACSTCCERFDAAAFEELFIVAYGGASSKAGELSATVVKTDAEKCPRCWNYRALGGNPNHPDVCERCGDALDALGYVEPDGQT